MSPIIKKIWGDDITELTDRFKRIKSSDRMNASYVAFKCNTLIIEKLKKDDRSRKELIDRSAEKPIYLITFDLVVNDYKFFRVETESLLHIKDQALFFELRNSDLNEVIDRSNGECFLNAPNDAHFITPSGKHTIKFLRLNDAIYSYNALDRISFWLQSSLKNCSAVVIDTWSLSSIILQTLQALKINIPFDCFHEHIKNNRQQAVKTLNKLSRRINTEKPILFLVGISSSGDFFKTLPSLLEESNINNDLESLSIFGFQDTPSEVNVLSKLKTSAKWFNEGECEYCDDSLRSKIYEIDSKYYYPRRYKEQPVRFTKKLLLDESGDSKSQASKFIHKFGHIDGVLSVHKDDPNDGIIPRHHAFSINVGQLMCDESFLGELNNKLQEIEGKNGIPDTLICPPHDAGKLIVAYIKERWKDVDVILDHKLSTTAKGTLVNAEHICFIDDVVLSGSRINNYLRSLREDFDDSDVPKLTTVTWFPLIARSTSDLSLDKLKDSLSGHVARWTNDFFYLYKIVLPDWSGSGECPWCEEEKQLDIYVGPLWSEPDWYSCRRSKLKDVKKGIVEQALLTKPISEPVTLGEGSALGDANLTDIQVIFLLAHGLQILRHKGDSSLGSG